MPAQGLVSAITPATKNGNTCAGGLACDSRTCLRRGREPVPLCPVRLRGGLVPVTNRLLPRAGVSATTRCLRAGDYSFWLSCFACVGAYPRPLD